ncbi:MAG TPA: hypothetical protein VH475_05775 [Tepidisphaeraceae bacterium]
MRAEMTGGDGLYDHADWSEAKRLMNEVDQQVIKDLLHIHRRLWVLEGAVRAGAQDGGFLENARNIFAANDERHRLKAQIDDAFPTNVSRRRTYGANT